MMSSKKWQKHKDKKNFAERHGNKMALVFIVERMTMIFVRLRHMHLKCGGFEIEEFEDAKSLYEEDWKKSARSFCPMLCCRMRMA